MQIDRSTAIVAKQCTCTANSMSWTYKFLFYSNALWSHRYMRPLYQYYNINRLLSLTYRRRRGGQYLFRTRGRNVLGVLHPAPRRTKRRINAPWTTVRTLTLPISNITSASSDSLATPHPPPSTVTLGPRSIG